MGVVFRVLLATIVSTSATYPLLVSTNVPHYGTVGVANNPGVPHAQDHVLVKVSPGVAPSELHPLGKKVFDRWVSVPVPSGTSAESAIRGFAARPGVELVELDYLVDLDPVVTQFTQAAPVDDEFFSFQWHLPQVQADAAWSSATGTDVVVAIVDTGVATAGEDLVCHTFVDPYNAITEIAGLAAADDDNGHGTHVAGTVAQCTDNGVGVAGVAFDADLMPVKVLDSGGSGLMSWIARGIDWAREHDADVINLSLGCQGCESSLLNDALDAAVVEGIVIVAASGNDGANSISYPASHPDTIAVGATEYSMSRTGYSNGGAGLDFVAPGGDNGKDDNGDGEPDGVLQETFDYVGANRVFAYYWYQGTSMATPHVAGAAALLKSLVPGLNGQAIGSILESTSIDLGTPGYDISYGHGFIQIDDALEYATAPDASPPTWPGGSSLLAPDVTGSSVTLSWPAAADNRFVAGYSVYRDGEHAAEVAGTTTTLSGLESGAEYKFEVRAKDGAGNLSPPLSKTVTTLDVVAPTWGEDASIRVDRFGEVDLALTWSGANDNVGVAAYRIRLVDTTGNLVETNRADITGLSPGTSYVFEVLARDLAGNWSEPLAGTARTAQSFSDIQGHLFYQDILWLSGMDITRGCNPPENDRFCPDDPVSRETMAAFLVRALDLKLNGHPGFRDVPEGSTFAEDIGRLATAGITRGCNPPENDRFCPDDPVSRETMAALLVRALELKLNGHPGFVDVPGGSKFVEDIGRLATAGVTRGCNPPKNDRFCPQDEVTRGQLAAFLKRALG